ncbi:MAG: VirB8/TrbF family protein [Pseudomonadota bacterium]
MHDTDNNENNNLSHDIENGAYYTQARGWYSEVFHRPIAERSFYIVIIILASINFLYAASSVLGIFPLSISVPFVVYTENSIEDWPRMQKLSFDDSRNKNIAVMKYFIKSYITNRESYDLALYELRYRNVWSQSNEEVFNSYKSQIAADNPISPYRRYTNLAKRNINIIEPIRFEFGKDSFRSTVIFNSSVVSTVTKEELSRGRWQADITYKYSDFKVDQRLNVRNNTAILFGLTENEIREDKDADKSRFSPMKFMVLDYKLKEILE